MDGPRPPLDAEFSNVVEFLDANLRPKEDWSITSEYPVAFAETNRGNMRIITEQDKVVSHAVIRPMIIKSPSGLYKVAGLGSVVTSTDHRNQGLSTSTIESCLQAAQAHGCDFAILWTDLYDFYRRMGFELGGSEMSAIIDRDLADGKTPEKPEGDLKFNESNKVDAEAIHRLFNQHTVISLRTVDETRRCLQIPNSRVYTAWDSMGRLRAYAIEGKGADLSGYVHEWGGGVTALLSLFDHMRKSQGRDLTVIIPAHSKNLLRVLQNRGVKINHGFLGMIKILNQQNLFAKLKRFARNLGIADLVLERRDGKIFLGAGDDIYATDSESDIVRLIFGPQKASEIHAFGKEATEILERLFPLHFWIWGWDSI